MNSCLECKHYKRSERIGVKCCEFGLDSNYCEKNKEDFAIEELEKIKAELEEIKGLRDNPYNNETEYSVSMKELRELIDEHISELKGENNPDCRNCDKWKTCENGEKGHANGTSIGYSIGECGDYVELKGE